ncbi:MAG: hypothetical protein OXC14_21135, partial [Rhodospirillaceae bacterium]|nr:hypothetical protein [Rhodospirillaceae bacterium]
MVVLFPASPIPGRDGEVHVRGPDGLGALLENRSIEVTPAQATDDAVNQFLARETRVFVPWLPGAVADETIAAAVALRERGMVPVPHIAARGMPDTGSLDRLLRRLRSEAAVDQLLVIGGDVASPRGPFGSALQLLETGLLSEHRITRVGIGGYPEGHPHVSDGELLDALIRKQDHSVRAGLNVFVITQFAFGAAPVIDWLRRGRVSRVRFPAHVGGPGPGRARGLVRCDTRCGVGGSL